MDAILALQYVSGTRYNRRYIYTFLVGVATATYRRTLTIIIIPLRQRLQPPFAIHIYQRPNVDYIPGQTITVFLVAVGNFADGGALYKPYVAWTRPP